MISSHDLSHEQRPNHGRISFFHLASIIAESKDIYYLCRLQLSQKEQKSHTALNNLKTQIFKLVNIAQQHCLEIMRTSINKAVLDFAKAGLIGADKAANDVFKRLQQEEDEFIDFSNDESNLDYIGYWLTQRLIVENLEEFRVSICCLLNDPSATFSQRQRSTANQVLNAFINSDPYTNTEFNIPYLKSWLENLTKIQQSLTDEFNLNELILFHQTIENNIKHNTTIENSLLSLDEVEQFKAIVSNHYINNQESTPTQLLEHLKNISKIKPLYTLTLKNISDLLTGYISNKTIYLYNQFSRITDPINTTYQSILSLQKHTSMLLAIFQLNLKEIQTALQLETANNLEREKLISQKMFIRKFDHHIKVLQNFCSEFSQSFIELKLQQKCLLRHPCFTHKESADSLSESISHVTSILKQLNSIENLNDHHQPAQHKNSLFSIKNPLYDEGDTTEISDIFQQQASTQP